MVVVIVVTVVVLVVVVVVITVVVSLGSTIRVIRAKFYRLQGMLTTLELGSEIAEEKLAALFVIR